MTTTASTATGQARVLIMLDLGNGEGATVQHQVDGTRATIYKCQECDSWSEEVSDEKLYQCGHCDRFFPQSAGGGKNGNLCPDCGNKFGSKVADRCCALCQEGEVDEDEGVICECGEAIPLDDWWQHVQDEHLNG